MKVRIVKCSNDFWYKSYIGNEFEIKNESEKYYYVHKGTYAILKSDCEIVSEDKLEKVIEIEQPQGTWFESKVVGSIKQKSEKSIHEALSQVATNNVISNSSISKAKEKPKKRVAYICIGCNCKCIIKLKVSCDVRPTCLYGDIYKAKWIKVVK